MSARTDVTIPSHGETLAAWLYRPEGAESPVPCVVMAHGFSATREEGLAPYAEAFQAAGLAALVFDYRHFGDSTGEPRQLLDIGKQRADYRAAIGYARALDGIDPQRIVLWGSSFSGGHVMALAQEDPAIAAVIAQAPFTDGLSIIKVAPKANLLRSTADAIRDQAGALLGRPPVLLDAVGAPGSYAVMTAPEAEPGFRGIVSPTSKWRNEVAARVMLRIGTENPAGGVGKLQMPLLVCACDHDETTPPAAAIKAAERAPRGELKRYPLGHFGIYTSLEARADQVEFLTRHVLGGGVRTAAEKLAGEPAGQTL
ncbi:alpha/beta fold hydrolase [Paraconexibacter antarcticus]|uniref:Alpha/beta fold hydrolase n=1 Tax=Paraconexibacter antarcticus TaxID=2949664 RepID=A0ABY5DP88_9ACTN|nr:alpha/beta hydrolase [Paraconexibacter antarcticus]UTI62424.1 alpha/beta fold hydrolase [Paraconexibacter antarcticus]